MYSQVAIQKLSHNQILKLLRGHRIRVKHGDHHNIHVSKEQHKKIMSAHKKGQGCCIQFDPFQMQMEEHHAMKGKGWFGDMAKKAVKHVAPHVIDFVANEGKKAIDGWGEGEGMHFAEHAFRHKVAPKKRGRPSKKGKGLKAVSTNPIGAIYNALPSNAKQQINNGLNTVLGIKSRSTPQEKATPYTFTKPKTSVSIPANPLNANQTAMLNKYNNDVAFRVTHPNFMQNHPVISNYINTSTGGALYPAGYEHKKGDGKKKPSKKGCGLGGARGSSSGSRAVRKPTAVKKGKGVLGSAIGGILGGVIGEKAGGRKGKDAGNAIGSIVGDFLPF